MWIAFQELIVLTVFRKIKSNSKDLIIWSNNKENWQEFLFSCQFLCTYITIFLEKNQDWYCLLAGGILAYHGEKRGVCMSEKDWMEKLSGTYQIGQIMETNEVTKRFGITVSEEEANMLVKEKTYSLKEKQRVEFGEGILKKLMIEFCDSPYLYQENFVESIVRIQDIFYEYKNESMDGVTDDELVAFMKQAFDQECQGSLDYLEETVLEKFAREIRMREEAFFDVITKARNLTDE